MFTRNSNTSTKVWWNAHKFGCRLPRAQQICTRNQQNTTNYYYYMASSASGQDEPNRALWLATRAGKMEPSCPLGTTRCIPQAKFHQKPYNKSFIDQVCSVGRSFFCEFMDLDFVSVHKHAKKNLANIRPSWPHTWSITHTYLTTKLWNGLPTRVRMCPDLAAFRRALLSFTARL